MFPAAKIAVPYILSFTVFSLSLPLVFSGTGHRFGSITHIHGWIPPSHLLCVSLILLGSRLSLITEEDVAQEGESGLLEEPGNFKF